jgi:hypothetical protein
MTEVLPLTGWQVLRATDGDAIALRLLLSDGTALDFPMVLDDARELGLALLSTA